MSAYDIRNIFLQFIFLYQEFIRQSCKALQGKKSFSIEVLVSTDREEAEIKQTQYEWEI